MLNTEYSFRPQLPSLFSTIKEFTPKLLNQKCSIRDAHRKIHDHSVGTYELESEWKVHELFAAHRVYVKSTVKEKVSIDHLAKLSKEQLFDFTDRLQYNMQTSNFFREGGIVDLRNHFEIATTIICLPNADMTHLNLAQDVICMAITTASVDMNLGLLRDFLMAILRLQKKIKSLFVENEFGPSCEHEKRLSETCKTNFLRRTSTGFVKAAMQGMNDVQQACTILELECRRSMVDAMFMIRFLQTPYIGVESIPFKQSTSTKAKKRDYNRSTTNEICLRFQDMDLLCCPGALPTIPSAKPRGQVLGGFWINPNALTTLTPHTPY